MNVITYVHVQGHMHAHIYIYAHTYTCTHTNGEVCVGECTYEKAVYGVTLLLLLTQNIQMNVHKIYIFNTIISLDVS